MLKEEKFILGLASFLVAHIIYIFAFSENLTHLQVLPVVVLTSIAILIYSYLYRSLKAMKLPVLIYVMAILIMAISSWQNYLEYEGRETLLALIGSLLFMFSDTTLAINKFKFQHQSFTFLIMFSYFSAQILIALSTVVSR